MKVILEIEHDGPPCDLCQLISFYAKVRKHTPTTIETKTIELGVDKKTSDAARAINELKRLVAAAMETAGYKQVSSGKLETGKYFSLSGRADTYGGGPEVEITVLGPRGRCTYSGIGMIDGALVCPDRTGSQLSKVELGNPKAFEIFGAALLAMMVRR